MNRLAGMVCLAALLGTGPAAAQGLDGFYYLSGNNLTHMRCNPDFIYADGGPYRVSGRTFSTVEGDCTLENPRQEGGSVRGTLRCTSEGMAFDRDIRLSGTSQGFRMDDLSSGVTREFVRC